MVHKSNHPDAGTVVHQLEQLSGHWNSRAAEIIFSGYLIILIQFIFRCGRGVPLPGYRLFSQCDPEGRFPCCNPNTGLCGNQARDCQCENCTDFRKMISAELSRWQPKKCKLKDYTWQESCSILNRNNISLHFIGKAFFNNFKKMLLILDNFDEIGKHCVNTGV